MQDAKTLAILPEEKGERLDKVLTKRLAPLTRSQVKRLIEGGRVTRNGKPATVHAFVSEGDTIHIISEEEVVAALPEIPVVAETDEFVVINKPAGLLVHQASVTKQEPTLVDWLVKRYPEIKSVGVSLRPGIVHRLDRDTSGLMVVAKTPAMFEHLKKQFAERLVKKTYIALVHGRLRQDEGEINQPIGRSRNTGRMAVRPHEAFEQDKPAVTKFQVIKRLRKPYTLIHAYPLTGRTHQIRAHFMAFGHPVAGDLVYTVKKQPTKLHMGRHFLHAETLQFTDLQGRSHEFTVPLPPDLQTFLDGLL